MIHFAGAALIREDFAGAGGCSLGKRLAGVEGQVIGVEIEKHAVATARAAGHERLHADVRSPEVRGVDWGQLDGYSAGPPCQSFSSAGRGEGRPHLANLAKAASLVAAGGVLPEVAVRRVDDAALDERSILVLEPMLVIRRHRPRWIMLEQVPQVLPIWEAYAEILREHYSVQTAVLKTEQFGVPQTRKRAILVARLDGEARLPVPTHSQYYPRDPERLDPDVLPWVSMAQALGWGMTDRPSMTVCGGGTATGGAEPFANGSRKGMIRERDADRWSFRMTPMSNAVRHISTPAPTIAVGHSPPSWVSTDREAVRVTVEEAGILQSFPADYPWSGPSGARYQQVGNACPPLLSAAVLTALLKETP